MDPRCLSTSPSVFPPARRQVWLDRFFIETRPRLMAFKPQELAQLMFAFGTNRVCPPRQWLNQLLLAAYSKINYFGPLVRDQNYCGPRVRDKNAEFARHGLVVPFPALRHPISPE